jgi:ssRNA-specific RNase YbeY (16S rRNA maturation enzyme)
MLHVVGLDDTTAKKAKEMRQAERHYMEALLGQTPVCQTPVCGEDA